ncbi:MAG TPA: hypothetical protein VGF95_04465 [Solirubrobacteraceae bacterium]|jgi:DNA-binding HxlR family transcriptional regulator
MEGLAQLGDSILRLLDDECMLVVLRELGSGPAQVSDVERRAPGIAHWTVRRRLQWLVRDGWASVAQEDGTETVHARQAAPPRGIYSLNDGGREHLLAVYETAVRCEQVWCPPPPQVRTPGLWAIKLVGDGPTRELARALADGPLLPGELQVRVPELRRATLFRRLAALRRDGVLRHDERSGRYAIAEEARHFGVIALEAGRCERVLRGAEQGVRAKAMISDLPGLLHMLAPLCHLPHGLTGTCHWHFDADEVTDSDIFLAIGSGHLAALATPATSAASAVSHATPRIWCDALVHGDPSRLETSGDNALVAAAIDALSCVLRPRASRTT